MALRPFFSPEELGRDVYRRLIASIKEQFPTEDSFHTADDTLVEAFRYYERLRVAYEPCLEHQASLDALLEDASGTDLVIFGPPGSGKSALLANWSALRDAQEAELRFKARVMRRSIMEVFVGAMALTASAVFPLFFWRLSVLWRELDRLPTAQAKGRSGELAVLGVEALVATPMVLVLSLIICFFFMSIRSEIARSQVRDPHRRLMFHCGQASGQSRQWAPFVHRVLRECLLWLGLESVEDRLLRQVEVCPKTLELSRSSLESLFQRFKEDQQVILVVDGLDELGPEKEAAWLWFLPSNRPRVRVIAATRNPKFAEAAEDGGWARLNLGALTPMQVARIVERYLAQRGKALSSPLVERISQTPACDSPRFLIALLDELVAYGSHENIEPMVERLLSYSRYEELAYHTLERAEALFEPTAPGAVSALGRLLLALRAGLSDCDLRRLVAQETEGLSHAEAIRILQAISSFTVSERGRVRLRDRTVADVFRFRYPANPEVDTARRTRIATLLKGRRDDFAVVERIWQAVRAGDVDALVQEAHDQDAMKRLEIRDPQLKLEATRLFDQVPRHEVEPDPRKA